VTAPVKGLALIAPAERVRTRREFEALTYLLGRSWRNQLLLRLRRLKQPRYAIATIFGTLYVGTRLFVPLLRMHKDHIADHPAGPMVKALATVALACICLWPWLLWRVTSAPLDFSPAEVQLLFPSPIRRQALVAYSLLGRRTMSGLLSMLFIAFLIRFQDGVAAVLTRAIALWLVMTVVSFHGVVAKMVRLRVAQLERPGRWGVLRLGIPIIAAIAILGCVAVWFSSLGHDPTLDSSQTTVFDAPFGVRYLLFPVWAVLAPAFAQTTSDFFLTIWGPLLAAMFLLYAAVRIDVEFEDDAAQRSEKVNALQARIEATRTGVNAPVLRKRAAMWVQMPAGGNPAVAIVWKNIVALFRYQSLFIYGLIIGVAIVGAIVAPFVISARGLNETDATFFLGFPAGFLVLLTLGTLVGNVSKFKNDLRGDMAYLDIMRALPMRGSTIVGAELLSSLIPLVAVQLGFLITAAIIFRSNRFPLGVIDRLNFLTIAVCAVVTFDAINLLCLNGFALVFPAWTSPQTRSKGVEAIGLTFIGFFFRLLILALAILLPAAAAIGIFWLVKLPLLAAVIFLLVAAGETYVGVRLLGDVFDSTDPSAVVTTT